MPLARSTVKMDGTATEVKMTEERQLVQNLLHAGADTSLDQYRCMKADTTHNGALLEGTTEAGNGNKTDYKRFGWWGFRPGCLQFLSRVNGMLFLIFWFTIAQGTIVNGLVNTSISSIEKRYNLSSSKTGLVSIGYDIGNGLLCLVVTYCVRTRRGKIKALSCGALLLWAGAMIFALPHFTVGLYNYGATVKTTCHPNSNDTRSTCEEGETGLSNYMFVFLTGQILQGIGAIPLWTFGSDLLEKSAPAKSGGFYLGLMSGGSALGPAIGYLLNGKLLSIYVDFNKPGAIPPAGGPSDPRWLGAWWLALPMFASIALLVSPWIAGIPGEYPDDASTSKVAKAKKEEQQEKSGSVHFFREMASLFKVPTLLFLICAAIGSGMSFNGLITFSVKYIENQFAQPAGWAAILAGLVLVPGGVGGSILGGFLMRRFRVGVSGALKLAIAGSVVMGLASTAFLLRCENINMAGVTTPYHKEPEPVPPVVGVDEISATCNLNCNCQTKYDPVCGINGIEYFSPCVAGCMEKLPGEGITYALCSCLPTNQSTSVVSEDVDYTVTSGHCPNSCGLLPVVLCILFIFAVGMASMGPCVMFSTLRCVQESQRSFALGFQSLISRFLGAIPGPIVFGTLIDRACLLWNESCDEKGACLVYDNTNLSMYFFTMVFSITCWIFLSLCLALYSWKRREINEKLIEENDGELDEAAVKRVSAILEIASLRETAV